jgi:transcriptional regulator with XRE-family HTH domain
MEKIDEMIATWVRDARKDAGLSQEALGVKLALELGEERGFTKANVSHWENKRHSPNLRQLMAIARITEQKLPEEFMQYTGVANTTDARNGPSERASGPTAFLELKAETAAELRLLSIYRLANDREREAIDDVVDQMSARIDSRTTNKAKRAS